METVLEVRNLTKTFPKRGSREALEAVADVSFRIEPGECLAVIGGSGSGKTTVAKMITPAAAGGFRPDLSYGRRNHTCEGKGFANYLPEDADGLSDPGREF